MIDLASYMDHFMPRYVADRVEKLLKERRIPVEKAQVLILGVTYKKDVKDLRESPALDIIEELKKRRAKLHFFDPLIPYLKIGNINLRRVNLIKRNIQRYDCLIIATDHSGVNYAMLQREARLIFDTRNVYKKNYDNVVKL